VSGWADRLRAWRKPRAGTPEAAPVIGEELLRRLRLEASRVADGVMSGFHASARLGRGVEFAGFRAYAPGDDLRFLDRRRSLSEAGLLVRQYEVEQDRALLVIVDGSPSMADEKRAWAEVVAGALVRIAVAQGDLAAVGVVAHSSRVGSFLRGKQAFERATELLVSAHVERTSAPAIAPADHVLEGAVRRVAASAGWLVIVGDFLDDSPPVLALATETRARGGRVVALRLETPSERDFPFGSTARLRDPESGDRVETFGPAARERYAAARCAHRERTDALLLGSGILVVDAWTDAPPERALVRVLEAIASRARAG
jgi:uncharacterized protein (DUF58 family)